MKHTEIFISRSPLTGPVPKCFNLGMDIVADVIYIPDIYDNWQAVNITDSGDGGSGTSSRFGVEDNLADAERNFDLNGNGFLITNASIFRVTSGDSSFAGVSTVLDAEPEGGGIYSQTDNSHLAQVGVSGTHVELRSANLFGEIRFIIDGSDDSAQPKMSIVGMTTGAGYVLTDVAGDNILSLQPSGASSRFGIEDNIGIQDRSVDMQGHSLDFDNFSYSDSYSDDGAGTYTDIYQGQSDGRTQVYGGKPNFDGYIDINPSADNVKVGSRNQSSGATSNLISTVDSIYIAQKDAIAASQTTITFPYLSTGLSYYSPLSVNGNFADETGNITISGGGGSQDLQSVLDTGNSATSDLALTGELDILDSSLQVTDTIVGQYTAIQSSGLFISNDDGTHRVQLLSGNPSFDANITFPNQTGTLCVLNTASNYANDAGAAIGGIPIGGLYHTSGAVKIRLT